ncbi:A/G-specific adenine glycosylase [Desulfosporosinus fructosivorans]
MDASNGGSNGGSNDKAKKQSFPVLLLEWYAQGKRELPWRKTGDPYAIWVSEVMLQQTQVKTVIPYYERFLQRFPSVEQLGKATLDEVLTEWRGLGYYSRARRMWEGANYLLDQRGGEMPKDYDILLQVPGIGKYTAGAIASIAFGQRVPAVDGNVLRVVSRILAWSEPVETVRSYRHFSTHLAMWQPALQPGDFNQALMELGAMVCTPSKPMCESCPLSQLCEAYRQDDVLFYPVKKPKAKRQIVTRLTFVLRRGDKLYLQKRPPQGLLADLWEFPGVELSQDNLLKDSLPKVEAGELFNHFQKAVSERGFDGWVKEQFEKSVTLHGPVWYTFSHRQWKIIWVIVDLLEPLVLVEKLMPRECLDQIGHIKQERLEKNVLKEASEQYQADSKAVHHHEKHGDWILLQDLGRIALPVAFSAIIEDLTKI